MIVYDSGCNPLIDNNSKNQYSTWLRVETQRRGSSFNSSWDGKDKQGQSFSKTHSSSLESMPSNSFSLWQNVCLKSRGCYFGKKGCRDGRGLLRAKFGSTCSHFNFWERNEAWGCWMWECGTKGEKKISGSKSLMGHNLWDDISPCLDANNYGISWAPKKISNMVFECRCKPDPIQIMKEAFQMLPNPDILKVPPSLGSSDTSNDTNP